MKLQQFLATDYDFHVSVALKSRTVVEYRRLIARLITPSLGDIELGDITPHVVSLWYLGIAKETPAQANRALAVLKSALSYASLWGHIGSNPARGVGTTKEKPRERYLTHEEVGLMNRALDEESLMARTFVMLCLHTGARPGELLSARWGEVEMHTLRLPDSKTGARTIYLSAVATALIEKLARNLDAWDGLNLMFPDFHYKNVWARVVKKAGLDGVRLYDLRHTYASHALGAGVNLEQISQLLGHSNPQTTRRYAHLMTETGVEAATRVSEALNK